MHNIKTNFDKIIKVIKEIIGDEISEQGNYLRPGTKPKFSDIEVIALSLTSESLSIDSENYLFSKLKKEYQAEFENMISRRQYNDRRKLLFEKTEQVRKLLAERLNKQSDVFAIDSMPLAKSLNIIARIKGTVLRRKNIFTATNCTVYVRLPE